VKYPAGLDAETAKSVREGKGHWELIIVKQHKDLRQYELV